ncbi:hypothetical protein CTM97_15855 [Photobacterium phosphoreum]|uniref:Uncharacterized protein n=1 Tax=Photobacterium phosphoreum TaxID=659 RepID=A0A2T3JT77_PHOPO|nr:hypothetical protein [Photobacterium phosphoreum]PSU22009.1 hypothetical protein CTM96_16820 [Photobacterium phosphoreum]PSU40479.1 hypothetical protein CTM97_15855 [Photobacterium phosphoreum]PSU52346.1 hypothetical protein C9J18_09385 [Photobacterium phosphoreum]
MTIQNKKAPVSLSTLHTLIRETTQPAMTINARSTLNTLNTETQFLDWLVEMVYRKEMFNHPEREFEPASDFLSNETLNTRLFIYDFQHAINEFTQCCCVTKIQSIRDYGRHCMLLVMPINEIEDCYSAAYISRQLLNEMSESKANMFEQLPIM